MDRALAARQIMELFIQAARQYHAIEKIPVRSHSRHGLHHSERHMLDLIGDHRDINITEFARAAGITKGAVSQVVKKLESKGLVRRYRRGNNAKEVLLELTNAGRTEHEQHRKKNEETLVPLRAALKGRSDTEIAGFVSLLNWIADHLEESARQMKGAR